MIRSHKIRLNPNKKQQNYFCQACGVSRFTWNWALSKWEELYKKGKKTSGFALKKEFNGLKGTHFPWVYDVTKYASQQPFIHVQKAFRAFFEKKAKYPKFKKKGVHDSFYVGGDQIKVKNKKVHIPRLGWVRLKESLRFEGHIQGVTISRTADKWFVSFQVETDQRPAQCENQASVGVDLGIKNLATLSNLEKFAGSKPLKRYLSKLRRKQRQLSRKQKGSNNRSKEKLKLSRLHFKIRCIRSDTLHKLTTYLTSNFGTIIIEDLKVKEMLTFQRLSRSISDMGFYEFKRQLEYKTELRGNRLLIADQWFPSSKKCSNCGAIKEYLTLANREYDCLACGTKLDRDLNAAKCLEQLGSTVSSTGIDACGQDGSVKLHRQSATSLVEAGTKECTDLYRF